MRKSVLAIALAVMMIWAGVAGAGPLHPALGTTPVAGESNMPIAGNAAGPGNPALGCGFVVPLCVQHDGTGGGPRVDWIVEKLTDVASSINLNGAVLPAGISVSDLYLFKYQVESTSGAPVGNSLGDLSRYVLSSPHTPPLNTMSFIAMGLIFSTDLDLPIMSGALQGAVILPATGTGGSVTVVPGLATFGLVTENGHSGMDNGGTYVNLNTLNAAPPAVQGSCFGLTGPACGGGGDKERDRSSGPLICCDNPVRFEASADHRKLTWSFDPEILHAGPGAINGHESTVLWGIGLRPVYGGGAALDGTPFSPWTTENPGGFDVPVASVPEPASLLLLGSGLVGLGFWARRRQS